LKGDGVPPLRAAEPRVSAIEDRNRNARAALAPREQRFEEFGVVFEDVDRVCAGLLRLRAGAGVK
jgi:hypothetical protein